MPPISVRLPPCSTVPTATVWRHMNVSLGCCVGVAYRKTCPIFLVSQRQLFVYLWSLSRLEAVDTLRMACAGTCWRFQV